MGTSRRQPKSFLIQQFFKNVGEFRASSPIAASAGRKSPCHPLLRTEVVVKKRPLFEAGQTRPPRLVKPNRKQMSFAAVPGTVQQKNYYRKSYSRKNDLQRPARKFPPCFCLPTRCNCPVALSEFLTCFIKINLITNWQVSKNAIAAGKQSYRIQFVRKCGLLAHTSAAFLKNCCTEKLFRCLRLAPSNYTAYATSNETKNRPSRNGFFSCSRHFFR